MSISVVDSIPKSAQHMVKVCLRRLDIGKWFVLVLCAWLANSPVLGQFGSYQSTDNRIKFVDAQPGDVLYPVSVNNSWGAMNRAGELVIFPRFDWVDHSYEGFTRVVAKGKTGFISGEGEWHVKPRFVYADRFAESLAIVGNGKKFAFMDNAIKLRTRYQFDEAIRFQEGMAGVRVGKFCGFINVTGEVVIKPQFIRIRSFHDGLAMVQWPGRRGKPGALGYIDKTGRVLFRDTRGRIGDMGDFHQNLAKVRIAKKWGYLDNGFQLRIKVRFDDVRDFHQGLAAVKIDDKWGFINKVGDWAVKPRFEAADDFDDIMAMVQTDGQLGFIDKTGVLRIAPQFQYAEPFFRKVAWVAEDSRFGYIDTSGNVVWNPRLAEKGFSDIRTASTVGRTPAWPANPVVNPQQQRKAVRPLYPPEYLYEQVLPQPRMTDR